jgi:hypothetical protein
VRRLSRGRSSELRRWVFAQRAPNN